MNIDQGQVLAFGRHVVSAAAGAVAYASLFHLFQNPTDAGTATDAINQIGHGFKEIVGGVAVLVPIGMGVIAAVKASPLVQMLLGAVALVQGKASAAKLTPGDQKTLMEATLTLPKVSAVVTNDLLIAKNSSPNIVSQNQVIINKPAGL